MTAYTEFFCDYCNPSEQRREPGDEVTTGYVRTEVGTPPPLLAWWATKGKYACPDCVSGREGVREEMIALSNATEADDEPTGQWPARTSPFGTQGG